MSRLKPLRTGTIIVARDIAHAKMQEPSSTLCDLQCRVLTNTHTSTSGLSATQTKGGVFFFAFFFLSWLLVASVSSAASVASVASMASMAPGSYGSSIIYLSVKRVHQVHVVH